MSIRPNPKIVEATCYKALSSIGIRMKYGLGTLQINEEFLGWIGLNIGTHDDFIRVNPNIGVHGVAVMKLISDANNEKYQSGRYATYSVPLGEVCPNANQFIFASEDDVLVESERLASTIKEFGLPHIHYLANYDVLIPLLYKRISNLGGIPERYAASLFLNGKSSESLEFLSNQYKEFVNQGLTDQAEKLKKIKLIIESKSSANC